MGGGWEVVGWVERRCVRGLGGGECIRGYTLIPPHRPHTHVPPRPPLTCAPSLLYAQVDTCTRVPGRTGCGLMTVVCLISQRSQARTVPSSLDVMAAGIGGVHAEKEC